MNYSIYAMLCFYEEYYLKIFQSIIHWKTDLSIITESQSTPEESGDTEESTEEPEIINILDVKKEALSKLKDLKEKLGVDQDFDDLDFDSLSIGSDSDDEWL